METQTNQQQKSVIQSYKLLSWNLLCKSLCDDFCCPKLDPKYREWDYRLKLFSKIFENNLDIDLFSFQEVDEHDDIKKILNANGNFYKSVHFEKFRRPQGISFFYRQDLFKLVKSYRYQLKDTEEGFGPNFAAILFLKDNYCNNFCIFITHLRAFDEYEPVRIHQIGSILDLINSNEEFKKDFKENKCQSIILCGDFNASPHFECVQKVLNIKLNDEILHSFKSVFNFFDKEKEDYEDFTLWISKEEEIKKPIDYIFFTKNLEIVNKSIFKEVTTNIGLPCETFPSDHCYLRAEFRILN